MLCQDEKIEIKKCGHFFLQEHHDKCNTHFLQLYLGCTPRAAHAAESLLPGGKSFFLEPYVNRVILRADEFLWVVDVLRMELPTKALDLTANSTRANRTRIRFIFQSVLQQEFLIEHEARFDFRRDDEEAAVRRCLFMNTNKS